MTNLFGRFLNVYMDIAPLPPETPRGTSIIPLIIALVAIVVIVLLFVNKNK